MICPRCGEVISDSETLCPFCLQDIDLNVEFNDYRKDGFVQIQTKNEADTSEPINYTPKYFNIAEFNIFVIAIVFVLVVSVFTVFSLRFVQKTHVDYVKPYEVTTAPTEKPTEAPTTENTVKKVTIKNLLGSWTIKGSVDTPDTAIPYYTFTDSGVVQENYGSITSTGVYKDLSEDDDHSVYIMVDNGFSGTYRYNVTGNKHDGYTLTLEDINTKAAYTLVTAVAKSKKLTPEDNPKIDMKLVGYWLSADKDKDYRFHSDGSVSRRTGETVTEGIWSVTGKNVITIQYMKETLKSVTLDYIINGKELMITNTTYKKQ